MKLLKREKDSIVDVDIIVLSIFTLYLLLSLSIKNIIAEFLKDILNLI